MSVSCKNQNDLDLDVLELELIDSGMEETMPKLMKLQVYGEFDSWKIAILLWKNEYEIIESGLTEYPLQKN